MGRSSKGASVLRSRTPNSEAQPQVVRPALDPETPC